MHPIENYDITFAQLIKISMIDPLMQLKSVSPFRPFYAHKTQIEACKSKSEFSLKFYFSIQYCTLLRKYIIKSLEDVAFDHLSRLYFFKQLRDD